MALRQYELVADGRHVFDGCDKDGNSVKYRGATKGQLFYSHRDMTQFCGGETFRLVVPGQEARDDWAVIRKMSFIDAKKLTGLKAGGWDELEADWRALQG